jgi:hypothetical protein
VLRPGDDDVANPHKKGRRGEKELRMNFGKWGSRGLNSILS